MKTTPVRTLDGIQLTLMGVPRARHRRTRLVLVAYPSAGHGVFTQALAEFARTIGARVRPSPLAGAYVVEPARARKRSKR